MQSTHNKFQITQECFMSKPRGMQYCRTDRFPGHLKPLGGAVPEFLHTIEVRTRSQGRTTYFKRLLHIPVPARPAPTAGPGSERQNKAAPRPPGPPALQRGAGKGGAGRRSTPEGEGLGSVSRWPGRTGKKKGGGLEEWGAAFQTDGWWGGGPSALFTPPIGATFPSPPLPAATRAARSPTQSPTLSRRDREKEKGKMGEAGAP